MYYTFVSDQPMYFQVPMEPVNSWYVDLVKVLIEHFSPRLQKSYSIRNFTTVQVNQMNQ